MICTFLELGQIVGTHGVRGELRINPWCDDPDFAGNFKTVYLGKNGASPYEIESCRKHKNLILMRLKSVDTVEAAEALRNRIVYIRRSDIILAPGVWFIEELLGCKALDADDNSVCYGTLTDISKTGANDVWQITDDAGKDYMIPAIREVVIDADVANDRVFIRPLKGIFDDAD